MHSDKLINLWSTYRSNPVSTKVHPDDHMFASNPHLDGYDLVGESGAKVIHSILGLSTKEAIWRILDFGCGHGRVARHLRSMFPTAEMWFADSKTSCVEFCAGTFNGTGVLSDEQFKADLPGGFDLIWVGSVFTHIDYERMEALFDRLFEHLGIGGILIATFRGRRTYEATKNKPKQATIYKTLLEEYESSGAGYQSYNREELGDWGLSLTSIERVVALGKRHQNSRLIGYSEAAWANIHDVGAWAKNT